MPTPLLSEASTEAGLAVGIFEEGIHGVDPLLLAVGFCREQFDSELRYSCGFQHVGYMIMAGEEDRPAIEHVVRLQQSLGGDAIIIGPEDVRELSPRADLRNIVAGCFEKKSGYADPRATVHALRAAGPGESNH